MKGIAISVRGTIIFICTIWNHTTIDVKNIHQEKHWVKSDFKNKENGKNFEIYNIYGLDHYKGEEKWWNFLELKLDLKSSHSTILAGNLNLVMNCEEKGASLYLLDPCRDKLENGMVDHSFINIKPRNGLIFSLVLETSKHDWTCSFPTQIS